MKRNWPENKANETKEEIQAEVREPIERSSRNQRMKLENNIVTLGKVEVLRKDNMDGEYIFLEEEGEREEVKLYVMPMERQGTCLGNSQRRRKTLEEEKHTFMKHRSMWKQHKQKEERTS
jgi:hypothetical protein